MKPTDVFSAILKAAGVVFWVYAIEALPAAIRYSPYVYHVNSTLHEVSDSINVYWQLSLARIVIYLVCGSLLVFGTKLFVRLAYGANRTSELEPASGDIANR